jgi:hypothetical protein
VSYPISASRHAHLVPNIVFFDIPSHLQVLQEMLKDYACGERHLLLLGNQGVGKKYVFLSFFLSCAFLVLFCFPPPCLRFRPHAHTHPHTHTHYQNVKTINIKNTVNCRTATASCSIWSASTCSCIETRRCRR